MKFKFMLVISIMFVFVGCGNNQPSFNPNSKTIAFIKGKPYYMPYNARSILLSNKDVNFLRNNHMDCRQGDIGWWSNKSNSIITANWNNQNKLYTVFVQLYRSGHSGCAHPLSNQQYQYVLQQQQINAYRAANNAQIRANNHARNMQSITNLTNQINSSSNQANIDSANMMNHIRTNNQNQGVHIIGKMPGGGYWYK